MFTFTELLELRFFALVFLEIVGRDDRTLAQVALEPRNPMKPATTKLLRIC